MIENSLRFSPDIAERLQRHSAFGACGTAPQRSTRRYGSGILCPVHDRALWGAVCADAAFNSVGRTTSTSAKVDFFWFLDPPMGFWLFNPPAYDGGYEGGYGVGLVGLIGFWFVAASVRAPKTKFKHKKLGLHDRTTARTGPCAPPTLCASASQRRKNLLGSF